MLVSDTHTHSNCCADSEGTRRAGEGGKGDRGEEGGSGYISMEIFFYVHV